MTLLARTRALTRHEWRVVIEAAVLTPVAAVAVRGLPLPKALDLVLAVAGCSRPRRSVAARTAPVSVDRLATLVEWSASRLRARCLVQALVLQALLRRRGVHSEVVVGAAGGPTSGGVARDLVAHAWVEHHGAVLMGAATVPYAPLYRLGGAHASDTVSA